MALYSPAGPAGPAGPSKSKPATPSSYNTQLPAAVNPYSQPSGGGYNAALQYYNAALQYYQGQYEPTLAALDLQRSQSVQKAGLLEARNGLAASQGGQNANFANQDYDSALARIGLQRNAVGIDTDYYNQLLGLYGTDLSGTLGYEDKLQALAGQLLGLQQGAVNQQGATATRNQISTVVPQGGLQSKNNILGLKDIKDTTTNQLAQLQQGYDTSLAGFDEARRKANEQFSERQLGIQHELKLNDNQLAVLDQTAKDAGLSRDKALSAIKQGLTSMNLNGIIGVQDVLDGIASNDFQRQQIGNMIVSNATADAYGAGYFGSGSTIAGSTPVNSKSKASTSSSAKKPAPRSSLSNPANRSKPGYAGGRGSF